MAFISSVPAPDSDQAVAGLELPMAEVEAAADLLSAALAALLPDAAAEAEAFWAASADGPPVGVDWSRDSSCCDRRECRSTSCCLSEKQNTISQSHLNLTQSCIQSGSHGYFITMLVTLYKDEDI